VPDDLSYFVPFLIYRVIAKGVRKATADYARFDLAIQEARILIVLRQHGAMRVGALADVTCIEASALSHILRKLGRRGLISRTRVEQDNRAVDVTLTPAGAKLAATVSKISHAHENVLVKRFSAQEQRVLRAMLNRMYENAAVWELEDAGLALAGPKTKAAK
jgi:DNA-binding MarR family transcriptional regulator